MSYKGTASLNKALMHHEAKPVWHMMQITTCCAELVTCDYSAIVIIGTQRIGGQNLGHEPPPRLSFLQGQAHDRTLSGHVQASSAL